MEEKILFSSVAFRLRRQKSLFFIRRIHLIIVMENDLNLYRFDTVIGSLYAVLFSLGITKFVSRTFVHYWSVI